MSDTSRRQFLCRLTAGATTVAGLTTSAAAQDQQVSFDGGSGTDSDPYRISDASQLRAIVEDTEASYELVDDVDASALDDFDPIGDTYSQFEGRFDGNGNEIRNLTVDRPDAKRVGLFGYNEGVVTDVDLRDIDVSGSDEVGGTAGHNRGTIENVSVTGTVTGDKRVGGIVGENVGSVDASTADCEVEGTERTGGIVGDNDTEVVANLSASGTVTGDSHVGGLVGWNRASDVEDSDADADVTARRNVGGLVGRNEGKIGEDGGGRVQNSSASGDVRGNDSVGGLVGINGSGVVVDSHAEGSVAVDDPEDAQSVGGLVGYNLSTVRRSYATTEVNAASSVGGLVGYNTETIEQCYAAGPVRGVGNWDKIGGLVGISSGTIVDCYATGQVRSALGDEPNDVTLSGFVAILDGEIRTSYTVADASRPAHYWHVGGLVARIGSDEDGEVTQSYWGVSETGHYKSAGSPLSGGLRTDEMTGEAAVDGMDGFAFDDAWVAAEEYPILAWQDDADGVFDDVEHTDMSGIERPEPDEEGDDVADDESEPNGEDSPETTEQEPDNGETSDESTTTGSGDGGDDSDGGDGDNESPGPGPLGAIAGVGGAGYLLSRRADGPEE